MTDTSEVKPSNLDLLYMVLSTLNDSATISLLGASTHTLRPYGFMRSIGGNEYLLTKKGKAYLLSLNPADYPDLPDDKSRGRVSRQLLAQAQSNLSGHPVSAHLNPNLLALYEEQIPTMPDNLNPEDFDFDGPGSGVNLALMMIPDDSPLATASYEERKAALAPKPKAKNRIVVASMNPVKIGATKAAFIEMYSPSQYFVFESSMGFSGVSDQPKSQSETRQGAENRARSVFDSFNDTLYSIGIEGGIEDGPDGMRSFAWVAIFDGQQMSCAQTAVFYLPDQVAELVRQGKELGEADDIVFSRINSKQGEGAIGLLTGNSITRLEYYTQAVIMALIPFKNEKLTWTPPDPSVLFLDDEPIHVVDPVKQNAVAAFLDALNQAEMTEASTVHTLGHQKHLRDLLAASKMLARVFPQIEGVPPVDQSETKDKIIESLRRDIQLQSNMIHIKNDQVMQLTNDLRKAREDLSRVRQTQRNATEGKRVSNKVVDPTDQVIEGYYDQGWERVFEDFSNGEHFVRFETVIPFAELDPEDSTKAAAAAPVPQPVIDHAIITGQPVPDYLREAFSNAKAGWDWEDTGRALMPAVTRFVTGVESPEAEHLAKWSDFHKQLPSWASKSSKQPDPMPESTEEPPQTDPLAGSVIVAPVGSTLAEYLKNGNLTDLKAEMNQQAVQAGVNAAVASLHANGWLTQEEFTPEPAGLLDVDYGLADSEEEYSDVDLF